MPSRRPISATSAAVAAAPSPSSDAFGADGTPEASEAPASDPDFMTSLARGLQVLRAFSEYRRHLTISQISQSTGISRAAVRRCLHTLKALGYAAEENRRFSLRPQVLTLGHAYLASTPLAVVAQPHLDAVSHALQESCSAAILDGDDIVYICRSDETRVLAISLLVGTRLPAYCTAMGQVLLAQLPPDALEAYLQRVRLVERTGRTITSTARLRTALGRVHEQDYALLDQELALGLRSIAVPVRDRSGRPVAAINVGAHASRATLERMRGAFLPRLRECAEGLRAALPG